MVLVVPRCLYLCNQRRAFWVHMCPAVHAEWTIPLIKMDLNNLGDALNTILHNPQQTQYVCITFVQRRLKVFYVGPMLYK